MSCLEMPHRLRRQNTFLPAGRGPRRSGLSHLPWLHGTLQSICEIPESVRCRIHPGCLSHLPPLRGDSALEGHFQAALWERTGVEALWDEISYLGISARLSRGPAGFAWVTPGTKSVRRSRERAGTGIDTSSPNGALTLQSLLQGIQASELAKSWGNSRLRVHLPSPRAKGMPKKAKKRSVFRVHREPKGTQKTPILA